MIEFTSSQLSWILIGACSIGGTGYITIDNKMSDMDKKVAVIQTKAENTDKKLDSMAEQLTRVEDMLRNIKGPR
mgnify:CR=1 FL=1